MTYDFDVYTWHVRGGQNELVDIPYESIDWLLFLSCKQGSAYLRDLMNEETYLDFLQVLNGCESFHLSAQSGVPTHEVSNWNFGRVGINQCELFFGCLQVAQVTFVIHLMISLDGAHYSI